MRINVHCHITTYGEDFSVKMGEIYEANYARERRGQLVDRQAVDGTRFLRDARKDGGRHGSGQGG